MMMMMMMTSCDTPSYLITLLKSAKHQGFKGPSLYIWKRHPKQGGSGINIISGCLNISPTKSTYINQIWEVIWRPLNAILSLVSAKIQINHHLSSQFKKVKKNGEKKTALDPLRYTFLWGGIQKSTCFVHVTVATAIHLISGQLSGSENTKPWWNLSWK